MTEQEYEKLVEEAADCDSQAFFSSPGTFLAGIKWARENPGPEVQELIQALIMVCHEWDAPEVYQSQISEALTRFKERSKG